MMSLIRWCHALFWHVALSEVLQNKFQVTQNKIIRLGLNMDPRAHVGSDVFRPLAGYLFQNELTRLF